MCVLLIMEFEMHMKHFGSLYKELQEDGGDKALSV